jgi:hypothetical protein
LKLVKIILIVETRLFFFAVKIFKIETFQLRLGCVKIFVETVEINRDISTLSRLFEVLQGKKSRQIEIILQKKEQILFNIRSLGPDVKNSNTI